MSHFRFSITGVFLLSLFSTQAFAVDKSSRNEQAKIETELALIKQPIACKDKNLREAIRLLRKRNVMSSLSLRNYQSTQSKLKTQSKIASTLAGTQTALVTADGLLVIIGTGMVSVPTGSMATAAGILTVDGVGAGYTVGDFKGTRIANHLNNFFTDQYYSDFVKDWNHLPGFDLSSLNENILNQTKVSISQFKDHYLVIGKLASAKEKQIQKNWVNGGWKYYDAIAISTQEAERMARVATAEKKFTEGKLIELNKLCIEENNVVDSRTPSVSGQITKVVSQPVESTQGSHLPGTTRASFAF